MKESSDYLQSFLRKAKQVGPIDEYHPHCEVGVKEPSSVSKRKKRDYRDELLDADPHCSYCGCDVDLSNSSLDHVVPRSKGGSNARSNLVLSCVACNQRKGNMDADEFRRLR